MSKNATSPTGKVMMRALKTKAFERLPDELVEAYGLDVEQFLKYTITK